ncbi:hypothetical protein GCM10012275_15730 [Longimycelium tulufanense]|uniref:DUF1876 domain-containing protein n=1 Tax=Longimycelium tulufanense TaxID=907463 RepID=A0A8J3FVL2_9PSEU|nr:DUF1876 domain-containing protein [Longimycelium tulufanense]GGM45540.1 hypothetical protein GCM10012275_15730 [Longimycelium tulufanense]
MPAKMWNVQIEITEVDRLTKAEARLLGKDSEALVGQGTARCNPSDENVPSIGDELASARALSDLSHQLLHAAAMDIESHTHQRVQRLSV